MATTPLNIETVESLMAARGIDTYAELARRAGMERTLVSRVLRGTRKPQSSHVIALARALMVPPVALLGPNDPEAALAELQSEAAEAVA